MPVAKHKKRRRKKPKIVTHGKAYSLKDCWLYNIGSKNRLCEKLDLNIETINSLCDDKENYQVFYLEKTGGKKREIQAPKFELDRVHSRIASLLARVKVPDYLHSGVKGRSSVTNAKVHVGNVPVLTLDIKNFYPSVSEKSVFQFYKTALSCSQDVAGLLAALCTYNGHVPTGSRLSMILAYWANQPLFSRLKALCDKKGVEMSVYVDDLTFSGEGVNRVFQQNVIDIIHKAGMTVHPKKTQLYKKDQSKVITGVVLNGNRFSIRNRHHKAIYEAFNAIESVKDEVELEKKRNELIGRLNAAGQIDSRFSQRAKTYRKEILERKTNTFGKASTFVLIRQHLSQNL